MIISHKHKFIFIKTNKTAGTSFEIALSGICGADDIITPLNAEEEKIRKNLGFRGRQNYKLDSGFIFRQHTTAKDIKENVAPETWDSYFKFCFERNPWDKIVSHFYWQRRDYPFATVKEYITAKQLAQIKGFNYYSINGEIAVDKIYLYEDIPAALLSLSKQLNLPATLKMPDFKAKSNYRKQGLSYKELLTPEEAMLIGLFFSKEIKLFGYSY